MQMTSESMRMRKTVHNVFAREMVQFAQRLEGALTEGDIAEAISAFSGMSAFMKEAGDPAWRALVCIAHAEGCTREHILEVNRRAVAEATGNE